MKNVRTNFSIDPSHELTDEEELSLKILKKRHMVTLAILEKNERLWIEDGTAYTSSVDPEKFGNHEYSVDGTSDCKYGCGL